MRRRNRAKHEQWRERIERWRTSGQSAAVFGRENGVSASSVYWWSRKVAKRSVAEREQQRPSTAITFMPLQIRAPSVDPSLGEATAGEAIEVIACGGRRVRVPERFSVATLQQVVRALEELR